MTPEQYAEVVQLLAHGELSRPMESRRDLAKFSNYLQDPPWEMSNPSTSEASYVYLCEYGPGPSRKITGFNSPDDLQACQLDGDATPVNGRVLVMQGNMRREWIRCIGAKLQLDPNFFKQHLDLDSSITEVPSYPSQLPSEAEAISEFCLCTTGTTMTRGRDVTEDLDERRSRVLAHSEADQRQGLNGGGVQGETIVRRVLVHNDEHFSLEQKVSVTITEAGSAWLVVLWLDVGRTLDAPRLVKKALQLESEFFRCLPVTYSDACPMSTRKLSMGEHAQQNQDVPTPCLQNAEELIAAFNYSNIPGHDPGPLNAVDCLLIVLRLVAASEIEYLNLVQRMITAETVRENRFQNKRTSLPNLLFHRGRLSQHARRLDANKQFLHQRFSANGELRSTRYANSSDRLSSPLKPSKHSLGTVIKDFDHLSKYANQLLHDCDQGIGIVMNRTMIEESQKAILQAEGIAKLTRLAFIFIPLSFTSSFFGMNFSQLTSDAGLSIWIWFMVSIPFLLVSVVLITSPLIYFWRLWRWVYRFI